MDRKTVFKYSFVHLEPYQIGWFVLCIVVEIGWTIVPTWIHFLFLLGANWIISKFKFAISVLNLKIYRLPMKVQRAKTGCDWILTIRFYFCMVHITFRLQSMLSVFVFSQLCRRYQWHLAFISCFKDYPWINCPVVSVFWNRQRSLSKIPHVYQTE